VPGENVTPDPVHKDITHLRDIYFKTDPGYRGRFTVPTLYDKKLGRIVNNESAEIIRMFFTEFDELLPEKYRNVVLLPERLRKDIDDMNDWVYNEINNGV
jgi:putative glutathione S-transferase